MPCSTECVCLSDAILLSIHVCSTPGWRVAVASGFSDVVQLTKASPTDIIPAGSITKSWTAVTPIFGLLSLPAPMALRFFFGGVFFVFTIVSSESARVLMHGLPPEHDE